MNEYTAMIRNMLCDAECESATKEQNCTNNPTNGVQTLASANGGQPQGTFNANRGPHPNALLATALEHLASILDAKDQNKLVLEQQAQIEDLKARVNELEASMMNLAKILAKKQNGRTVKKT